MQKLMPTYTVIQRAGLDACLRLVLTPKPAEDTDVIYCQIT